MKLKFILVNLYPQLIKVKFMFLSFLLSFFLYVFFVKLNTPIFVLLCKTYNSVCIPNMEHYNKSSLMYLKIIRV